MLIVGARTGLQTIKVTRPYDLAREAGVESHDALYLLRSLGYEVKSPSTRLTLEPTERQTLVDALVERNYHHPDILGLGHIVGASYRIWTGGIDKVLGFDKRGYVWVVDEHGRRRSHLTHCQPHKRVVGANPFVGAR